MKFNRIERSAKSLAVVCSTVVLAFGTSTAGAETEALTYRLSVIQDAAYGRMILADDFESAIDRLEDRSRRGIPGFFAATNLCVAYIKTGDLEHAAGRDPHVEPVGVAALLAVEDIPAAHAAEQLAVDGAGHQCNGRLCHQPHAERGQDA